ncbi:MAG: sensor histidine kinase [Acidobacteriota bacterium]|nr:sensor histidine kinase [Acidobacteriota bacterium]
MTPQPNEKFTLSTREVVLIFAFWTFLATLSAVNRLLDPRGFGFRPMSPAGPITLAFIEAWTWAAVTPFILWLSSWASVSRNDGERGLSPWVRVPLLLILGIGIAILVYTLLDAARFIVIDPPVTRRGRGGGGRSAFAPLREIGRFRFLNQLLVYLAVLAAGFAREFFRRDQRRQQQAAQLQAQLAEARLDALRMQINPHFLFNTLHAVSALVERDPGGVRRMIARLSELLRYTIDSRATDEVPLRDELAFLRRYIEIMEVRFQGKLRVEMNIAADAQDALVPNLILQPIVENALEHGVNRSAGEGQIEIAARRDGERLVLTVRDNGPGLEAQNASGVGLANTRARLEQLYGDRASLELRDAEGGGVLAQITLPYREHA